MSLEPNTHLMPRQCHDQIRETCDFGNPTTLPRALPPNHHSSPGRGRPPLNVSNQRSAIVEHLRNYLCAFDRYLEKLYAMRNIVQGLRMLRIFSIFLKNLNFLKLRFGGCCTLTRTQSSSHQSDSSRSPSTPLSPPETGGFFEHGSFSAQHPLPPSNSKCFL